MNDEILLAFLKKRLGELELEVIHLQAALERERQAKEELSAMLSDKPHEVENRE
ncbi:hypothetical protein [Agrobacterium tumefaciens]|uniref:hypothetical protein n=1 Tax=Agrobacterium tumefaciens TaxID=358 RepID=UPI003BA05FE1